jgi:hypothetical protein
VLAAAFHGATQSRREGESQWQQATSALP